MSGPYQGWDLSNCGVGRLRVAINCGVLSVNVGYETSKRYVLTPRRKPIAKAVARRCMKTVAL